MKIDVLTIVFSIVGIMISVIGFFLIQIYKDFKTSIDDSVEFREKVSEDLGKLKGQIELVHQEQQFKYQEIEKTTQLEIKMMAKEVGNLASSVNTLIKLSYEK